jgi:alkylation response protein AidB-like acyl-CoA dehydrogenase
MKESSTVDWVYSEEQEALRATVRRFLDQRVPAAEVRRLMESELGYDPTIWSQMAEQLGLQGLAIPEEYGGSGFGWIEVGIVLQEMGRSLLPSPYFATVALAVNTLLACGDEAAKKDLLPGIASGETIATLALTEEGGSWDPASVRMTARRDGERYLLDGVKTFVLDGHVADLILVVARTEAGLSLFALDSDVLGLSRVPLPTLDGTRRQARLTFAGVPGRLIGTDGGAQPGLVKALDRAAGALAAEQIGGAEWCLTTSVAYAQQRVQFGRPIGSFQAVKHKLADMFTDIELAKSAAQYAVWHSAADTDELPIAACMAKAYASEAFWHAAVESIQTHGGIGFTWEHDLHLYFKRAKTSQILLGHPRYHRELLAQRVGLG